MNAKLYPQLAVQKIGGGVTFCCFNAAAGTFEASSSTQVCDTALSGHIQQFARYWGSKVAHCHQAGMNE